MHCSVSSCTETKLNSSLYCRIHESRWVRYKKYGFTPEHFQDLQAITHCEICNEYQETLNTDHDHNHCPPKAFCPVCVRGMLCTKCNMALGQIDAKPDWWSSVMQYRKHYNDQPDAVVVRTPIRRGRPKVDRAAWNGDAISIPRGM